MIDLSTTARIERARCHWADDVRASLEGEPDARLFQMIDALIAGNPDGYAVEGFDQVKMLEYLAVPALMSELQRRMEVAALEEAAD